LTTLSVSNASGRDPRSGITESTRAGRSSRAPGPMRIARMPIGFRPGDPSSEAASASRSAAATPPWR